jgi:acetyl-CoA carboxylase biotin carboxyl carrier protein
MLEPDKIRELVEMMVANDLIELSLRDGDKTLRLKRPGPAAVYAPAHAHSMPAAAPAPPAPAQKAVSAELLKCDGLEAEFQEIRSPMVGTFYASPDPESPPFVQAGSHVGPSTIVCILEAMKVFSEIKAETSGVIDRVLVRDGQAVEYGQPLFLVRPG